jgi:outer membrane lipopolysaccharide assembly protein LptE/RlpB
MSRPIDQWSAKLNKLQTQQKYTDIEAHIKNYLSLYGLDVLRTESQYYINILITNLKRWDKIARSYKFFSGEDGEKNLVIILLEIAYSLLKKNKNIQGLFIDVELYLLYEDFGKLLEYAVDNNAVGIIDKLMAYDPMNVLHKVNDIYGTCIEYKVASLLSGKKIIKIINDHLHPGSVSL